LRNGSETDRRAGTPPTGHPTAARRARPSAPDDAERYLTEIESTKLNGAYIDPARARLTIGAWAAGWLDGQPHLKPSTAERSPASCGSMCCPDVALADASHADVQAWVAGPSKASAPATVRKVHRVLSLVLALAVKDAW
jgi:hypothetical protein